MLGKVRRLEDFFRDSGACVWVGGENLGLAFWQVGLRVILMGLVLILLL